MNNKKLVIAIIIIVVVIIIGVVGFLIYKNKKKQKEDAAAQMAILQQQLSQPNMPVSQKQSILEQIAGLAAIIGSNIPAKQNQGQAFIPGVAPATATTSSSTPAPADFPLKKNSSGLFVQAVQKAVNGKCGDKLKAIGMAPLVADGKFGPLTEKGVASCLGTTTVSWEQYKQLIG